MLIPIIVVYRLRLAFYLKLGRGWGYKEVRTERVRGGWLWAEGSYSIALSAQEHHLVL